MFLKIIKWVLLSLLLISLVHYLFIFFKDNLTIPKTKDLVTKPIEKYEIMEKISSNKTSTNTGTIKNNLNKPDTTMINDLNTNNSNIENSLSAGSNLNLNNLESSNMKNELKTFFSQLNDI